MKREMGFLEKSRQDISYELKQLEEGKRQYQVDSQSLALNSHQLQRKALSLDQQEQDLKHREEVLQRGLMEIKVATQSLHTKKQDLDKLEEALQVLNT